MVEAQLSISGLAPLQIAADLGHEVVFVTNDLDRYRGIGTLDGLLAGPVTRVITGDTNSVDGILAAVAPLDDSAIAALYTHCDYNLPLVAAAARHLGLPGLNPEAAAIARDKLRTREVCARAGIPAPRHIHAATLDEALAAAAEVGFPCVVKPMTESASTGVSKAFTAQDVAARFAAIAASPVDARGQRRRPGVLVEEFVLGYEVSVESVTHLGRTTVLGVTDKTPGPSPFFAELGDTFPSQLPAAVTERLAGLAVDALSAIGFDFGAAHTEVRMTADGPKLIEINARIGGAEIAHLVELATGIAYREQIVRMHMGETPKLDATRSDAAAARHLAPQRAGVVTAVHGTDLARRVSGVVDVDVHAHPGQTVSLPTSNHELVGHVVATAATAAEAAALADTAIGQIFLETTPAG
jgi:biotin carboxylase